MTLRLDTTIPYGNACDVAIQSNAEETEVSFSADPHGGLEALWFCFRLTSDALPPQSVKLVLKNPQNLLGHLPATNIRPVWRTANADWERLSPGQIETLPDGRIQVVWQVTLASSHADIAFCYPYGMPDVEQLVAETDGYWKMDVIGVSQGARPIVRLSNRYSEPDSKQLGIYLVARQHSGETSGSWLLDGFLRHLATLGDSAPLTWVIPLSNIDGVEQGDYGKDNWPYDLNRAWHAAPRRPMRYEVLAIQHDVRLWSTRCTPMLGIDFHSPGGTEADGIYFHLPDPEKTPQGYLHAFRWAESLQAALTPRYARPGIPIHSSYPSRWEEDWGRPGFTTFMWSHGKIPTVSVETPYGLIGDLVMTREEYQHAGKLIAQGVVNGLPGEI